ncbi:hypothetical protein C8Q76DRAFT_650988 [Earliella scabrosa]|nr:hypothetical protein C8Q76DRAFT_650988 [Earliella scabrosa]
MNLACGAHFGPGNDQLSSSAHPPFYPIDTLLYPWRTPPHRCDIAKSSGFGFSNPQESPEIRAKSTPPFEHHRQSQPYPSPPLTDAALASTVPLPEVPGEPPRASFQACDCEDFVDVNMSHDGDRHIAPLSPPPTALLGVKDLPPGGLFEEGEHQVESWRYGEDMAEGAAGAPLFPPVRDDSGFEEFGPQEGCGDANKTDGSHGGPALIEPTSVWSPYSPLSLHEGLPEFPPLLHVLPSGPDMDRSSGHTDSLLSPVSPSDAASRLEGSASGSDMDWDSSPGHTFVDLDAPSSPKSGSLSLDLPALESPLHIPISAPSPLSPLDIAQYERNPHWFPPYGTHQEQPYPSTQPTPLPEDHSPFSYTFHHPLHLHAPSGDLDSDYPDTVMPSEDDDDNTVLPPPSPRRRPLNDLHDPTLPHGDVALTPIPRSPHATLFDFDMADPAEPPESPHSPHHALPELEDDGLLPSFAEETLSRMETISPSLLGGAPEPQAGLGLCLQPLSDLPLARSPSPDEDDFGFLDVQLDPESVNVEVDEFLQLRALRKYALAQERAARMAEADLNERITAAASALLPPSHAEAGSESPSDGDDAVMHVDMDVLEKRARKRDLHALMDARAEARRMRKLQKQRSKEIGALLDFKMHSPMSPMEGLPPLVGGKGWTRSVAHLVAHMIFRRRDRSRPLENKVAGCPAASPSPVRRPSHLRVSESAEDLLSAEAGSDDEDGDGDDDMEL